MCHGFMTALATRRQEWFPHFPPNKTREAPLFQNRSSAGGRRVRSDQQIFEKKRR